MAFDFVKVIRDPIHNYIGITQDELDLISLPVFQRLRRITQLSFCDFVYPDAKHSRFSHSLGVMHLAGIVGDYLKKHGILDDNDIKLFRFSGLLHDLGHGPFSHAFEPVLAKIVDSDENKWKGASVRWTKVLISEKSYGVSRILGKERVKLVGQLIDDENTFSGDKKMKIVWNLLTGPVNIDRLDYIKRDAFHAGTPEYAILDIFRIINTIAIDKKNEIYFFKKGLYALEGLFLSYLYLYSAVYFHRTVRGIYSLFQEIALRLSEEGIFNKMLEPGKWECFDDNCYLHMLREKSKLLENLLFREIPKVIIFGSDIKDFPTLQQKIVLIAENLFIKRILERKIAEIIRKPVVIIDSPHLVPYPEPRYLTRPKILEEEEVFKRVRQKSLVKHELLDKYSPHIGILSTPVRSFLQVYTYFNNAEKVKIKNRIIKCLTEEISKL